MTSAAMNLVVILGLGALGVLLAVGVALFSSDRIRERGLRNAFRRHR